MAMSSSLSSMSAIKRRRQDPLGTIVTILAFVAMGLVLLPIIGLVASSLNSDQTATWGLDYYQSVLGAPKFGAVILNTAIVAIGSLVVMFVITIPLAWLYARTDFYWRRALLVAATSQIAIPGFLVALGYIFLLSPTNGIVNLWWREIGGQHAIVNVYSMLWIILLQGITMVGPAFYFLAPAFSSIDGAIEEAASVHGVGKLTIVFRILLPMTMPALISTALFFLVISVETFDYVGMLGMPVRIDVVATWVYQFTQSAMSLPQYGHASAIGTLTALVLVALIAVQFLVFKRSANVGTIGGRARAASVRLSRKAQWTGLIGFSIYAFMGIGLPLLMLIWTALLPTPAAPSIDALSRISLSGFGSDFWTELVNVGGTTLFITLLVAFSVLLFTISMSWIAHRAPAIGKAVNLVTVISLAVPSIVIAVVFNTGGLAAYRYVPIFGTVWLLAMAIGSRYLATAHRITENAFRQLNPEMVEYARTAGVKPSQSLLRIAIPAARTGLLFAWFWVALLTLKELPITLVLSNSDVQTLASRIFLYNSAGQTQQAASLSLALFSIVAVFLAGFLILLRRPGARS
ncbi:ABC transporter permease subunit [Ochrobactrum sp. GPK 3]|uniref:ABC transporter permease n=1 Tax=Brucella sp. 22210 TaxID=3453892 RepID=UPI0031385322